MRPLDTLENPFLVKCYQAVPRRGLLDAKLFRKFSGRHGSPGMEDQIQGFPVLCSEITDRFRLFEMRRRRANKDRKILGRCNVDENDSSRIVSTANYKHEIAVAAGEHVLTERHNDIMQDYRR